MFTDLRHALRSLRSSPGFTITVILTLALGVGVTIAMYSVVHATLVRPLPYREPDRITAIVLVNKDGAWTGSSLGLAKALRESDAFEAVTVTLNSEGRLLGNGEPEDLNGFEVDAHFFRVMTPPALGRGYTEQEPDAVVLTHPFWQRRFGSDPAIVGGTITIEPEPVHVLGVMPPGTQFGYDVAFLRLLKDNRRAGGEHGPGPFEAFGRIARGLSAEGAQARADLVMARLRAAYPAEYGGYRLHLVPFHRFLFAELDELLFLLLGAVGFVLLIACTNISTLLLVRATVREHDAAVRASLGASRWRLIGDHLVEGVVLALPAAAIGVFIAAAVLPGILHLVPSAFPRIDEARIDAVVALIAVACSVGTATLATLWPALTSARTDLTAVLARRSGEVSGGRRLGLGWLIATQVALSIALLAGAGMLGLSLYRLAGVETGVKTDGLVLAGLQPGVRYDDRQRALFYTQVVDQIRGIPGVRDVTLASIPPVSFSFSVGMLDVNAPPAADGTSPAHRNNVRWRAVLPSYFQMLAIRLLRGRNFDIRDAPATPLAVIINEAAVRLFPEGVDPIGRRVTVRISSRPLQGEIVGIAQNVRSVMVQEPRPELFVSAAQVPPIFARVLIRSDLPPMSLAPALKAAVWRVDPNQPVERIEALTDALDRGMAGLRFRSTLFGAFSAAGILLAIVGIWAVSAYSVVRRSREIGIRVALGARRAQVMGMLLDQTARPVVVGIGAGLIATYNLSSLLEGWLFQVKAADVQVHGAMAALFASVALAAIVIPARRALRIDPAMTLQAE